MRRESKQSRDISDLNGKEAHLHGKEYPPLLPANRFGDWKEDLGFGRESSNYCKSLLMVEFLTRAQSLKGGNIVDSSFQHVAASILHAAPRRR